MWDEGQVTVSSIGGGPRQSALDCVRDCAQAPSRPHFPKQQTPASTRADRGLH
jgi:hypothetical protein